MSGCISYIISYKHVWRDKIYTLYIGRGNTFVDRYIWL